MITKIIKFLNDHYHDSNPLVCEWLTKYIHSSCRYCKQNVDNSYLITQPAWPEKTVVDYRYYSDSKMSFGHHTNRFILVFDDNTEYDISIYKFKRYLRRKKYVCSYDDFVKAMEGLI